jgi:hypothetical protein
MIAIWRSSPSPQELDLVRRCLDEAYPLGTGQEKLRALIYCVRRRCKGGGHEPEAISRRAHVSFEKIEQVLAGKFHEVRWESIEAVLKALDATPADIAVALELYLTTVSSARARAAGRGTGGPTPTAAPVSPLRPPLVVRLDLLLKVLVLASPKTSAVSPQDPAPPAPPPPAAEQTTAQPPTTDITTQPNTLDPKEAERNMPEFTTVAEFVERVKLFRAGKGNRSFRDMNKTCRSKEKELSVIAYSAATYSTFGKSGTLPKKELLRSYIVGAGASREELDQWTKAHARLAMKLLQALQAT